MTCYDLRCVRCGCNRHFDRTSDTGPGECSCGSRLWAVLRAWVSL